MAKQLLPATIQCLTEALCVFVCDCWNFKDLFYILADLRVLIISYHMFVRGRCVRELSCIYICHMHFLCQCIFST